MLAGALYNYSNAADGCKPLVLSSSLSAAADLSRYVADLGVTSAIVGIKSGHGVISIENDRVLVSVIKNVKKYK